jgi:hypothetical protein
MHTHAHTRRFTKRFDPLQARRTQPRTSTRFRTVPISLPARTHGMGGGAYVYMCVCVRECMCESVYMCASVFKCHLQPKHTLCLSLSLTHTHTHALTANADTQHYQQTKQPLAHRQPLDPARVLPSIQAAHTQQVARQLTREQDWGAINKDPEVCVV